MTLTAPIVDFAINLMQSAGYTGVAVLMIAESMILPVPSEAVMPFAGFLIADGTFSWLGVIVFSTVGSIIGSLISYWIGAAGGRPLVQRWGKYVLVTHHDLDMTDRFFQRYGGWAVFTSRFIPVVRHFISIPAGVAKMPMGKFLLATVVGATLWNTFLAWVGVKLGENWERIRQYSEKTDIVVLILLVGLLAAYIYRHVRRREAVPPMA